MLLLINPPTLMTTGEAETLVDSLTKDDSDWTYFAVDATPSYSYVEVRDEEGEVVGIL